MIRVRLSGSGAADVLEGSGGVQSLRRVPLLYPRPSAGRDASFPWRQSH